MKKLLLLSLYIGPAYGMDMMSPEEEARYNERERQYMEQRRRDANPDDQWFCKWDSSQASNDEAIVTASSLQLDAKKKEEAAKVAELAASNKTTDEKPAEKPAKDESKKS